jgi:hypothetical protein
LKAAIKILNNDRIADEKTIRELSQWKDENQMMAQELRVEKAKSARLE